MKLYLASTSPRRNELLNSLNIRFEIVEPHFEERPTNLTPRDECLYFAEQKARSVASQYPQSLILSSDTLIACQGEKLGKPTDEADALRMLRLLSGRTHQLFTAVVLLNTATEELQTHVEEVAVTFHPLSEKQINDYVATGEPMNKAGAYAVQQKGKELVARVEGDLEAVIGLPLSPIRRWLKI